MRSDVTDGTDSKYDEESHLNLNQLLVVLLPPL